MSGEVGSTTGLLSLVMEAAGQGLGVIDPLRDILSKVTPVMFDGDERRLFEAAQAALDQRQTPTAFNIARLAGFSPMVAARVKQLGKDLYGDLRSAADAVARDHSQREMVKGLTAALTAAQKGQLDSAQVLAHEAAESTLVGDPASLLTDYHEYDVEAAPEPRHITLALAQLNEDLGGGLGAGGSLCMSMVAAPSGVGKSTFAFQQIPHWLLNEKHWVLYATGEMTPEYVYGQVTRIHGRVSEAQYNLRLPVHLAKLRRANAGLREAIQEGRFTAFSEDFTPERIRELARLKARELNEARLAGAAPETARLIVVVDNWDNLFESYDFGALREDQVFQREMQRFAAQASEYGYHHMNLAQTNGESEAMKGPAEAYQMQGSKKLNAKTSHQIVLYRSRDLKAVEDAQREAVPPLWSYPQIAVRKARGGGHTGPRIYRTDTLTGTWHATDTVPSF